MSVDSLKARVHGKGWAVPAAALVAGAATDTPVSDMLFPGPVSSAFMGVIQGSRLIHKGGLNFGGMFGYKTLFSGITNAGSNYTIGNMALTAAEAIGGRMYDKGIQTTFTAWSKSARQTGLAGLFGAFEEGTESVAKSPKFSRFFGGLGDEIDTYVKRTVSQQVGDKITKVTKMFPKFKPTSYLVKGTGWAALGTMASAYSWIQLASIPTGWVVNKAIEHAENAAWDIRETFLDSRKFAMGKGYLNPSFQNQHAATERQRAISAIYSSRVNPSNRMYGREANMYHR